MGRNRKEKARVAHSERLVVAVKNSSARRDNHAFFESVGVGERGIKIARLNSDRIDTHTKPNPYDKQHGNEYFCFFIHIKKTKMRDSMVAKSKKSSGIWGVSSPTIEPIRIQNTP